MVKKIFEKYRLEIVMTSLYALTLFLVIGLLTW